MKLNVSPPSLINQSPKLNQAMVDRINYQIELNRPNTNRTNSLPLQALLRKAEIDPSLTQEVYGLYKENGWIFEVSGHGSTIFIIIGR